MFALQRDVCDVIDLSRTFCFVLLGKLFQRAKLRGKSDQLLIVQTLVAKTQHVESLKCVTYFRQDCPRQRRGNIEANHFRPEFINRLDEIVIFNQLTKDDMQRIVENELVKVNTRMNEKGHELVITQPVIEWLIQKSFHEDFGARPLKRGIEKHLEDPLSEKILRGSLETPYMITATMIDEDTVDFEMVEREVPSDEDEQVDAEPVNSDADTGSEPTED